MDNPKNLLPPNPSRRRKTTKKKKKKKEEEKKKRGVASLIDYGGSIRNDRLCCYSL